MWVSVGVWGGVISTVTYDQAVSGLRVRQFPTYLSLEWQPPGNFATSVPWYNILCVVVYMVVGMVVCVLY